MPDMHKTDAREDYHKRLDTGKRMYNYQEMFGFWLTIQERRNRYEPRLEWVKSGTVTVFCSNVTFDRVACQPVAATRMNTKLERSGWANPSVLTH